MFKSAGQVQKCIFDGAVAQLLEHPVCVREVVGSIPGRVIPKTFKIALAALSFAFSTEKEEIVSPVSV